MFEFSCIPHILSIGGTVAFDVFSVFSKFSEYYLYTAVVGKVTVTSLLRNATRYFFLLVTIHVMFNVFLKSRYFVTF
jgi:hypothetical protein